LNKPLSAADPAIQTDRARALALTPVSRETLARLDAFVELLFRWQARTNLVATSELPRIWTRHIADSLQLVPLMPKAKTWVDLGSGGGFPGIPIACALAEKPGAQIHLVESNGKKAAFLRESVRVTGVPALVHQKRIEDCGKSFGDNIDLVSARALASLTMLCGYAQPLIARGAVGLFPKGQDVEAELTEATKYWSMTYALEPSRTGEGTIVVVRGLARRDEQAIGRSPA
jgi:16S rRNA (guanine527-N7)-methyltransferase